ncbi:MAG: hypothetical protein R3B35_14870 [Gemmatimonadales bacterium]
MPPRRSGPAAATTRAVVGVVGMLALLLASAGCGGDPDRPAPYTDVINRVSAKYGPVDVRVVHHDTLSRLELRISDLSFRDTPTSFPEVAEDVATIALGAVSGAEVPDSIVVTAGATAVNLGAYQRTRASTARFAVAALREREPR